MAARGWRVWSTVPRSRRAVPTRPRPRSRCGTELRRAHPGWGPRTIGYQLEKEGVTPLPSRSAIYRTLLRHRLPKQRRKRRSDFKRWERGKAMELWQMDVMGGVRLSDGTELKVVTGIDDHSRFCVSAVRRATAKPVCETLAQAMRRHRVPDQILTDNGKVFKRPSPPESIGKHAEAQYFEGWPSGKFYQFDPYKGLSE